MFTITLDDIIKILKDMISETHYKHLDNKEEHEARKKRIEVLQSKVVQAFSNLLASNDQHIHETEEARATIKRHEHIEDTLLAYGKLRDKKIENLTDEVEHMIQMLRTETSDHHKLKLKYDFKTAEVQDLIRLRNNIIDDHTKQIKSLEEKHVRATEKVRKEIKKAHANDIEFFKQAIKLLEQTLLSMGVKLRKAVEKIREHEYALDATSTLLDLIMNQDSHEAIIEIVETLQEGYYVWLTEGETSPEAKKLAKLVVDKMKPKTDVDVS